MARTRLVEPTPEDKARPDYPYWGTEVDWEFQGLDIWCKEEGSEDTADRLRAVNILASQFPTRMATVEALKNATEDEPIVYQGDVFFWTEER